MTDRTVTVAGLRVFDPRDGQYKVSANPGLILLDIALRERGPGAVIRWDTFVRLADFCDEEVIEYNGSPRHWSDVLEHAQ